MAGVFQQDYGMILHVGIKEPKAKLNQYVNRVRDGNNILIKDPAEEVAVIAPLSSEYRTMLQLVHAF